MSKHLGGLGGSLFDCLIFGCLFLFFVCLFFCGGVGGVIGGWVLWGDCFYGFYGFLFSFYGFMVFFFLFLWLSNMIEKYADQY